MTGPFSSGAGITSKWAPVARYTATDGTLFLGFPTKSSHCRGGSPGGCDAISTHHCWGLTHACLCIKAGFHPTDYLEWKITSQAGFDSWPLVPTFQEGQQYGVQPITPPAAPPVKIRPPRQKRPIITFRLLAQPIAVEAFEVKARSLSGAVNIAQSEWRRLHKHPTMEPI